MAKIGRFLLAPLAAFLLNWIGQNFSVNVELTHLKEEFVKTAKESARKPVRDEYGNLVLNYHGKLDEITKKRDDYLRQNSAVIFGGWNVVGMGGNSQNPDDLYIRTSVAVRNPFCFRRVKPYNELNLETEAE